MKTETDAIHAGHRIIIKRAMRMVGLSPEKDESDRFLNSWAINNPCYLAPVIVAWFNKAAKAWEDGNNSGCSETLNQKEAECERIRTQAESILNLFHVETDYPGLYPAFKYKHVDYYSVESLMKSINRHKPTDI